MRSCPFSPAGSASLGKTPECGMTRTTLVKRGRMQRQPGVLAITAVLVGGAIGERVWAERGARQPQSSGATRTYYVAADELDWNYAPADHDHMTGKPYGEWARYYTEKGPGRIGPIYRKAVYREC